MQMLHWQLAKVDEPKCNLFYWIGSGFDFAQWCELIEQDGQVYKTGSKELDDDIDFEPMLVDFSKIETMRRSCAICRAELLEYPTRVKFRINGKHDRRFPLIGGKDLGKLLVVHQSVKAQIEDSKLTGASFVASAQEKYAAESDQHYFYVTAKCFLESIRHEPVHKISDDSCSHCGRTPLRCAYCSTASSECPTCHTEFTFKQVANTKRSHLERSCDDVQFDISEWNGDDFVSPGYLCVTGRAIEWLFEQNYRTFTFGPVCVEFKNANKRQREWANAASRTFF